MFKFLASFNKTKLKMPTGIETPDNPYSSDQLVFDTKSEEWLLLTGPDEAHIVKEMEGREKFALYLFCEIEYHDFCQMVDEYQEKNFDYEPGYIRTKIPWAKFLTVGLDPGNSCTRIDCTMKWVEYMDLEILVPFKSLLDDFVKNRKSLHQKSRQIAFKMSRRMERAGLVKNVLRVRDEKTSV